MELRACEALLPRRRYSRKDDGQFSLPGTAMPQLRPKSKNRRGPACLLHTIRRRFSSALDQYLVSSKTPWTSARSCVLRQYKPQGNMNETTNALEQIDGKIAVLSALLIETRASLEQAQRSLIAIRKTRPNDTALLRLELAKLGLGALDLETFCAAKTMDDLFICVADAMVPERN
jgi:hypothetical protein